MSSNSFTLTPTLKTKLNKIDSLYKDILTIPVSSQTDTQLRLQAMHAHLEGWAKLANHPLTRQQVQEMVGQFQAKSTSPLMSKVLSYKNSLNYVREHWTANASEVTFDTIRELSVILGVNLVSKESVEPLLTYLYASQVHPVLQAGLAHLAFYPSRSAYLLSLLFMAKSGYDLRGWLSLEDCWGQNKEGYIQTIQEAATASNATAWLEYFCQAVIVQMSAIKVELETATTSPHQYALKHLNTRQKDILTFIERSETPVTNRQIKSEFGISQITASRDLSKLSISGLLASHGSGRSTSYTKI